MFGGVVMMVKLLTGRSPASGFPGSITACGWRIRACRPEHWKRSGNGWPKTSCGIRAGYGTDRERSRPIEKEMRRRSLYKYYSERKWAEEFLDGKLLLRS